jgi:hypothetical protein
MGNAPKQLHDAGQSIWLDYITREIVQNGTLERYIDELSLTGLTSNPTIFEKALSSGDHYDEQIGSLLEAGKEGEELFFELAITDLQGAADLFRDVHEKTGPPRRPPACTPRRVGPTSTSRSPARRRDWPPSPNRSRPGSRST